MVFVFPQDLQQSCKDNTVVCQSSNNDRYLALSSDGENKVVQYPCCVIMVV